MTKYIYYDQNLRCCLKPTGYENQIELQIQKKFLIFWINVYRWMHVKEGFWGECDRINIIKNSYQYGNISECYMTGTLDIRKRVSEFFIEYFEHLDVKQQGINTLKKL